MHNLCNSPASRGPTSGGVRSRVLGDQLQRQRVLIRTKGQNWQESLILVVKPSTLDSDASPLR